MFTNRIEEAFYKRIEHAYIYICIMNFLFNVWTRLFKYFRKIIRYKVSLNFLIILLAQCGNNFFLFIEGRITSAKKKKKTEKKISIFLRSMAGDNKNIKKKNSQSILTSWRGIFEQRGKNKTIRSKISIIYF